MHDSVGIHQLTYTSYQLRCIPVCCLPVSSVTGLVAAHGLHTSLSLANHLATPLLLAFLHHRQFATLLSSLDHAEP